MHHVRAHADFEAIILVPRLRCRSRQIFGKRKLASATFLVPFGEVTPGLGVRQPYLAAFITLATLTVSVLMCAHPLESVISAEPDRLDDSHNYQPLHTPTYFPKASPFSADAKAVQTGPC